MDVVPGQTKRKTTISSIRILLFLLLLPRCFVGRRRKTLGTGKGNDTDDGKTGGTCFCSGRRAVKEEEGEEDVEDVESIFLVRVKKEDEDEEQLRNRRHPGKLDTGRSEIVSGTSKRRKKNQRKRWHHNTEIDRE